MSADLFAEFNELSNNPPPAPTSSTVTTKTQPQRAVKDPFDFFQSGNSPVAPSRPPQQWSPSQPGPGGLAPLSAFPSQSQPVATGAADDDDTWGAFEVAEPGASTSTAAQPRAWEAPASAAPVPAPETRSQIVRASTFDLMTNNLVDIVGSPEVKVKPSGPPSQSHQTKQTFKMKSGPKDPSVLFDAEDFELQDDNADEDGDYGNVDDDDFGDFESVPAASSSHKPAAAPPAKPSASLDLLSLVDDDSPAITSQQYTHRPTASQSLGGMGFGATSWAHQPPLSSPLDQAVVKTSVITPSETQEKPKLQSHDTEWPSTESIGSKKATTSSLDDDWGAWDDRPRKDVDEKDDPDSAKATESWGWDTTEDVQTAFLNDEDSEPPPINVPPPSIILSVFPDLLNSGAALFKPIAGQNTSIKQRVLSDPKSIGFLRGYILVATTAAHVIAGRKQRWHRDKILAKSMSISAAGSKGMKLAGVDKTQSAREDREAADVADVWRENVGRLRSAVAAANSTGKVSLKVPELAESLQVQTAKLVPTAPKPCIVCGLKRDERVAKVDVDVEDSFGEWWVDHWGHRACKNFWLEHEQKLRQR